MAHRSSSWAPILTGLVILAGQVAPARAQLQGSPVRALLQNGAARLLWIYDGIRHVELPLANGKAVFGLNCERQTWTLFRIERNGQELYSFRNDPEWGYQPAGPIASSRLCTEAVRVAE
mgnify:CR=1 FL=1